MTTTGIQHSALTPDLLRRLATESAAGPFASVYLGPHRPGASATPKSILRAVTQRIGHQLRDGGMRGPDIEDFLRPLVDLAAQPEFEQGHGDAWAVFRAPSDVLFVRASGASWPEAAAVGPRFYLLPAIEWLGHEREAFLLAITGKGVRLYRLRGGVLTSVSLPPGTPAQFDADRLRNAAEHAANRSTGVHFGVADVPDRASRVYRDYFAEVGRGLAPFFERSGLPVLLAGTKETLTAYREVASGDHILPESLTLSPDGGFPLPELESRMTSILAATPRPAELRACQRIQAEAPRLWVTEETAAVRAAEEGRVATLFAEAGRPAAECDLVNQAAVQTIAHGGEVWLVPATRMPASAALVAELRFPR